MKRRPDPKPYMHAAEPIHLIHDEEQNRRIVDGCRQQRAVHNRTVGHLLTHRSDEPTLKNTRAGVTGLYGHWSAEWKNEPGMAGIQQLTARGAISAAADQVRKWESTNEEHATIVAQVLGDETRSIKNIPRRVQRRDVDPKTLFRSRNKEEREGAHRYRIDENVNVIERIVDEHGNVIDKTGEEIPERARIVRRSVRVPGLGELRLKEEVPEGFDIRSCVIVERTPKARLGKKLEPEKRTFTIHLSGRRDKPELKSPKAVGRTVGLDHGIVYAMTAADSDDNVETFQHDLEAAQRADRRIRKAQKKQARCTEGSTRWEKHAKLIASLRATLSNQRRHCRRHWANYLTHRYDTICVEELNAAGMTRSAKGTSEAPGTNVKAKTGLNRSLAGIAPAEETNILLRTGERTGTRIELVNAAYSSQRCNACGYTHPDNRQSQAEFRCVRCGHQDNADANGARNHRDTGVANFRARMDASRQSGTDAAEGTDAGRPSNTRVSPAGRRNLAAGETAGPKGQRPYAALEVPARTRMRRRATHDSRPDRKTQESRPCGQYS